MSEQETINELNLLRSIGYVIKNSEFEGNYHIITGEKFNCEDEKYFKVQIIINRELH